MSTITVMTMKKHKTQKTQVGIFKTVGGNLQGGTFSEGNSSGGSLMGRNFSGGSFPDTRSFPNRGSVNMEDISSSKENVTPKVMKVTLIAISFLASLTEKIKRKEHVEKMFLNISLIFTKSIFVRRDMTQLLINCYREK